MDKCVSKLVQGEGLPPHSEKVHSVVGTFDSIHPAPSKIDELSGGTFQLRSEMDPERNGGFPFQAGKATCSDSCGCSCNLLMQHLLNMG